MCTYLFRFARYQHLPNVDNDVFPNYDDAHEDEAAENEARYLREDFTHEDVLKTKFVFSEEPIISIKLTALKSPLFRETTHKTTRSTTTQ